MWGGGGGTITSAATDGIVPEAIYETKAGNTVGTEMTNLEIYKIYLEVISFSSLKYFNFSTN